MSVIEMHTKEKSPMLAGIDDPALRERVTSAVQWLGEKYSALGTWAKVARAVGGNKSAAYFNSFVSGSYAGSISNMLDLVERARQLDFERANTVFRPEFVSTTISKRIERAVRQTRARGELGILSGESGIGKSTTFREMVSYDPTVLYIRANATMGVRNLWPVLTKLVFLITGAPVKRMSQSEAYDILVNEIAKRSRVMVLDESQFFSRESLDMFRTLAEDSGVAILFAGNDQLHEGTFASGMPGPAFTQFISRCQVNDHIVRADIKRADVKLIAEQVLAPEILADTLDALFGAAREAGGFRRLHAVLQRAHEKANGAGASESQVLDSIAEMTRRGGIR